MASAATQAPTSSTTWDAGQYYLVASQLAAGQAPAAEAPYVYRLGLPWLVAQGWPSDPARGFLVINVACGLVAAVLLSLWLRSGVERLGVRLAMVALFAASWHGPIRYVYFNGGYVDPPFLVSGLLTLMLLPSMRGRVAGWSLAALTALTVAGTFVRETMLLLPASAMLLRNPVGRGAAIEWRRLPWFLLVPAAAGVAVVLFTHAVVVADTTRSFVAAAMQWIRKPPTSYLLAWFTTYGPVLAVPLFDWRRVARDLGDRQHLLALLALCAGLAYLGGSDTERFVFWAMPVVYLVTARAIERNLAAVTGGAWMAALVIAQAVSARVFWTIPDPRVEPAALGSGGGAVERLYGIADRVFVIDHFHWNLWSSFGSAPFRLARLALYLGVTGMLVWGLSRRSRELAAS